jgi:Pyridoxamine 5'-phosphate oxidase
MSELLGSLQDQTFARATAATASSYPLERRLTAAQLAGYLDRRAFAVVGSTRPDGRPHAAMSSYIRRDLTFWLPTVAGSVRERNLRGTPWLTM